jgi:hypothetical protein
MRKLYEDIRGLKRWPRRGRIGCEEGTRELLFPPLPYVAVYRVIDETAEVVRIYHAAQGRVSPWRTLLRTWRTPWRGRRDSQGVGSVNQAALR